MLQFAPGATDHHIPRPRHRFFIVLTLVGLAALMAATPSTATTFIVHPDGSGEYPTIQAAINAATDGDIIELTNGLYVGAGNRDINPGSKTLTVRSASGEASACVIQCDGSAGSAHRGFRFNSGTDADFLISGITITGGYSAPNGGAVYCSNQSSPTFEHCVFEANVASENGGAVYCSGNARPVFRDCSFLENSGSYYGGAVRAIYGSPSFYRCHFELNQCHNGGALSYYRNGSPEIIDCTFSQNSATRGGGIFIYSCVALVSGCTFTENSCLAEGGGIVNVEAELTVNSSVFQGNHAHEYGGGISTGGIGWLRVDDCLFIGNSSLRGGAVNAQYSELELTSSTLVGNRGDMQGSSITIVYSSASIDRAIITGGLITSAVFCEEPGFSPSVNCTDIHGHAAGDWTGCLEGLLGTSGNIAQDPWFCDADNDIYTLHAQSPCATSPCGLMGSEPVDCDDPTGLPIAQHHGVLLPAYPNPGSGGTNLAWRLPQGGNGIVEVFNLAGQRVWQRSLAAEGGPGTLHWSGCDQQGQKVGAGVYLVRLLVNGTVIGRQPLILLR